MFDHFVKGCDMMRDHGAESIACCPKIFSIHPCSWDGLPENIAHGE
jgi:hypothetical protein